jgi:hypothetical protein
MKNYLIVMGNELLLPLANIVILPTPAFVLDPIRQLQEQLPFWSAVLLINPCASLNVPEGVV